MTPRISLVAVCCSSDSLSSLNSLTFSIAITAWSAKVSSSLICAGVNGRASVRRAVSDPMNSPCWRSGTVKKRSCGARGTQHREFVLRPSVGNVERTTLANPPKFWRINTDLDAACGSGYGTKFSPRNHGAALTQSQRHVINPTNPSGARHDCLKHRLHICRRTADDAEHLGSCGLMLQRLAQFCVAVTQFLEQPYVLDGDHGLVSESFHERDLTIREGLYAAPHAERANRPLVHRPLAAEQLTQFDS